MPTYGGFEPLRVVTSGALTTLHEARAEDRRPGRFALKIFHPAPSSRALRTLVIEGWMLGYERQRDAAKAGKAAREVVSFGRCAEGAYAVLPWLPASMEGLVESLKPTGDRARALARLLLTTLESWQAGFGGPHGRLKSSNVFLEGSGPLETREAVLTDPACPPGAGSLQELHRRDLHGVASMLVRIIRGRSAGGWPIEAAPEWHALGRAGTPLREFCNTLLAPASAGDALSLAEAHKRLARIPADAKPLRVAAYSAAGLSVATAAGVIGFARFGSFEAMPSALVPWAERLGNPRVFRTEVAQEWAQLCRGWNTWVGDLLRFSERWDRTDALWAPDDPLRPILAEFRTAGQALDPRVVVPQAAGFSLGVLGDSPPEKVRQELLRSSVDQKVQAAWVRMNALAEQLASWPRWQALRETRQQLTARGFPRVSASLHRHHPDEAAKASDAPLLVETFNRLSEDTEGALLLLPRWKDLEVLAAEMDGSGDRVQKALPGFVLSTVADRTSVGEFADALVEPADRLRRLRRQFLDPEISRERFLREATVLTADASLNEERVKAWEQELETFRRVAPRDDPRRRTDWDQRLRALRERATDLEPTAPTGDSAVPTIGRGEFDGEVLATETRLAGLRSRDLLKRDLPVIEQDLAEFQVGVQTLEQRVDGTLALLRPSVWLERVAALRWERELTQQRWELWRRQVLGGVTASDLEQDRPRFRTLRASEQTAKQWLADFEGPTGLGGLTVVVDNGTSPDVMSELRRWGDERRQRLAQSILTHAWPVDRELPEFPWEESRRSEVIRPLLEVHAQWLATLPGLARELDALAGLLIQGLAWKEGVEGRASPLLTRNDLAELQGKPAEWLAESRVLGSLQTQVDRAMLLAAARGPGFAVRLDAWRRLGSLDDWPATIDDLDTDGALAAGLAPAIAAAPITDERRASLQQEWLQETRRRWNRAARRASGAESDLSAVFSRMDRFGVEAQHLDADVAFNLRLWQLKQARGDEGGTDYWRTRRDTFVTETRRQPEVVRQPAVAALLSALESLALKDDPQQAATRSPARAGWKEILEDGGQRVRVAWAGAGREVSIEFQLVQPKDGTAPFYLARKALSVGDFVDLMTWRPEGGALFERMPRWVQREGDGNEPWTAPLAWRPRDDRAGLELNAQWIYRPDAQVAPLLEDRGLGPPEPALEPLLRERPTSRSPLQRISPGLAKEFVERVLGARLLTPREWLALVSDLGVPERLNGRDPAFARLWSHLESLRVADQVITWRPNQDIYLPLQTLEQGGRSRRQPMRDTGEVTNLSSDSHLWPAPVDEGPETGGFIHLFGNVWTYLHEPETQRYFVAGGSSLSPPALDPRKPHPVEGIPLIGNSRGRELVDGFSDVGIRPAFDAPPGLRDRMEMFRLVRLQQFLTL